MNDTGLEPVFRRQKGGVLGHTLVIQIVAPRNLRNHTSNVTRYGRKTTEHYNLFTVRNLVRRDGFEPSSILIKSQVLYRLATDA